MSGTEGTDLASLTFQFTDEDHTLGNVMRYLLLKNPDVEFAGYAVPHPAETKMNLHVQTSEGMSSVDCMREAAADLGNIAKNMREKITEAVDDFVPE
ncbi:hypothetical protein KIPB_001503 [Kipferlia bialata]|uniref:DNA-directed RNA polymerase RBP11-like dimerisation domain-containing protein n=1 Tax=Kipferlia bialata TaxID=797122 RepID=A0A9K3GFL1_9EUKA|nr:hypothetical protein KIPB_001503 [Kipferlia bialata]|eukprot:g1503.t1